MDEIVDGPDKMATLKGIVNTLFKVIGNIQNQPMEPKFRKLPKKSERI